jgi:phosphate transport system permease protein
MSATVQAGPATPAGSASGLSPRRPLGDRAFQLIALVSGLLVLVILVLIAVTMSQQSTSWFTTEGWSGIFSTDWDPAHGKFGAMAFVYGTVVTSLVGVIIAFPISMGVALLLTEVVPRRWSQPIVYVIDLLAVVPSVVWGLWGFLILVPWLQPIYAHVASAVNGIWILGNLFGFLNGNYVSGASFFTAGLILAIMITPIVTSLSREVIATVPTTDKEGAYALGATRWEMIRGAVWPHSQTGIVGATLLGLGRAMGETIAVALVIGSSPTISSHLFTPGYSMPSVIANQFGEATVGVFRAALIGMGVLLFLLTILVNLSARAVVERNARRMRGTA